MSWEYVFELIKNILITQTGIPHLTGGQVLMLMVALIFLYLAVAKGFEPLLLLPIGFGIFLVNFPLAPIMGFTAEGNPDLIRVFLQIRRGNGDHPLCHLSGAGGHDRFRPADRQPQDAAHRRRRPAGGFCHLYRRAASSASP